MRTGAGDSTVTTEQDVLDKEANSSNLHLFLAMVGDEVAGYCGLSEYREDQDALYIPLLNVHPQYQGLKIGKKLVITAVEKTVELGWPRLDLFTWPGNTKAVPLYKKCGFFWEDRDDTVHLMNFIPMVLQIELLKPFFKKHDWYHTSQRSIEIKPDGLKEQDHTVYEYRWEAGEDFVRIQVERTGRGIRLIETNDLFVQMSLPHFKLLEKVGHTVSYRVENRMEKPVEVELRGILSPDVQHDFQEKIKVDSVWEAAFPASVEMPDREPSPWKTHPTVGSLITVNGVTLPLKMGIFPKQAGKLHLRSVKKQWRPSSEETLYLDLESQLNEDTSWTIKLPNNDVVQWKREEVKVDISGNGRTSVSLPVQVLRNGHISEDVTVSVEAGNGETTTFTTRMSHSFPGSGAKFGGETEEHWTGYNGPYYVEIEKRNHIVKIGSTGYTKDPITLFTPKLGKPYSEEFSKKEASAIEFIELPEAFVMKTTLMSDTFPSILLNSYYKIFGDGLVEIKHEVVNTGASDREGLSLFQPIFTSLQGMAVPHKDGVLIGNESLVPFMDYLHHHLISERWLYLSSAKGESFGLSWPDNARALKDDWRMAFEYHMDHVKAHEEVCLGPIRVGVDVSGHWSKWRETILGSNGVVPKEVPLYSFEGENGDVVCKAGEMVDYSFKTRMSPYVHGNLTVRNGAETLTESCLKEEEMTSMKVGLKHQAPCIKWLKGEFQSPGQHGSFETVQFVQGSSAVKVEKDGDIWSVDNGALTFQASASYFPGIFSLKIRGEEVLDHQYPSPGPRGWWNPWGGGIGFAFHDVSAYSKLKEATEIEHVTKVDQHGNEWSGICLITAYREHEKMKGVILRQYALTLPDVPVFAIYAEIQQDSGRTFAKELLDLEAFFKIGEDLSTNHAMYPTEGIFKQYYAGTDEVVLRDTPYVTIGADGEAESISVIHPHERKHSEAYLNQDVFLIGSTHEWSAATGETVKIKPTVLFHGSVKNTQSIRPIQNLNFQ